MRQLAAVLMARRRTGSPVQGSRRVGTRPVAEVGGAGRDRTADLLIANEALSQLSYAPESHA